MAAAWDRPSPEAAALLREAAVWFRDHAAELVELLDAATIERFPEPLRTDVTLIAEAAASTRANIMHWAQCTIADPGGRVPVNLSPEVLAIARDAIRRGADRMLLSAYHASQNVAWRYSMQLLFSMSSEPKVLAEALDLAAAHELAADAARAAVDDVPRVRVALGLARGGIEGFRLSHLDALAAQRLLHNLPGGVRVARFADVELIALAASDVERAGEFVARTLGDLATADPALRDTLRAYVREEFSASRAARALF